VRTFPHRDEAMILASVSVFIGPPANAWW
jgi:hypothetical protein